MGGSGVKVLDLHAAKGLLGISVGELWDSMLYLHGRMAPHLWDACHMILCCVM